MNKTIPNISAILFMFILFVPYSISAYDGEQHLEGGHELPDSHSESHEEGSGMHWINPSQVTQFSVFFNIKIKKTPKLASFLFIGS